MQICYLHTPLHYSYIRGRNYITFLAFQKAIAYARWDVQWFFLKEEELRMFIFQ